MVKAIVSIDEDANRILNIVKAKENLNDKSDALNLILKIYGQELLEPSLRPEFISDLLKSQNQETVKVNNWDEHFNLN